MNRNEPQNSSKKKKALTQDAARSPWLITVIQETAGKRRGARGVDTHYPQRCARPRMSTPSRLPRFHNHFPPMIRRCPQRRFLTSHPRQPHAARHTHTHTHTHTGRSRLPFRHPYPPLRTVRRWRRQYYLLFPLVSVFSAAAAHGDR